MKIKCHIKIFRRSFLILLAAFLVAACGRDSAEEPEELVPDHIGKARAFYHQGDYLAAVEMYHKALELDPDNSSTYLQLGIIYDDNLKDEEQAVYFYNQFLIREPDSDKADRVRGWIAKSTQMIKEGADKEEPVSETRQPEIPRVIQPQEELLPTPAESITPAPERGKEPPAEKKSVEKRYTVRQGDTLAGIADKFYGRRTDWKRIYEANRDTLANPNALKVGQELIIPNARDRAVVEM